MPQCDIIMHEMRMKNQKAELMRIAHGSKDPWQFCFKVGIDSVRNLEIFLKKTGTWDGHEWSHGELADEYGISRPRSVQICARTRALLQTYYAQP